MRIASVRPVALVGRARRNQRYLSSGGWFPRLRSADICHTRRRVSASANACRNAAFRAWSLPTRVGCNHHVLAHISSPRCLD